MRCHAVSEDTQEAAPGGETDAVILRAFLANLGIAIAKFVAAAITGSSAMLTEGVHSLVDTLNEMLLWYGRKRSRRPADALHPLGYGRELYFWTVIVGVMIFGVGAGVSFYEGVEHIRHPVQTTQPLVAFGVLGVALLLESWSLVKAVEEFQRTRKSQSLRKAIHDIKDIPTLAVLLEDSAAVAGILIAAVGIGLELWFDAPVFDGIASILIGVLLAGVAVVLLRESKHLLIGESADPDLTAAIGNLVASEAGVARLCEVIALQLSPDTVIAVISLDFDDAMTANEVETRSAELEARIVDRLNEVERAFVRAAGGATPRS